MYRLMAALDNIEELRSNKNTAFAILECGHYRIITEPSYSLARPWGRNDFQLLYVADGCIWFTIDGVDIPAHSGEFVIYSPGAPQYYRYYAKDKTNLYWVHLCGNQVFPLLNRLSITCNCLQSSQFDTQVTSKWLQMLHELALKQANYQELASACMLEILSLVSRLANSHTLASTQSQKLLLEGISYISNNLENSINIQQLAKHLGVSVSWLNTNFKTYTGISPLKYATNLKIRHAKDLLQDTECSIQEIAEQCGYSDSLYFSRIFHKYTNMSPRMYRNSFRMTE